MQDRAASFPHNGRSIGARPVLTSLLRGAAQKCPACGKGAMFRRYLKVVDTCPYCGEEDLEPQGAADGEWHCRSCTRSFQLRFAGIGVTL